MGFITGGLLQGLGAGLTQNAAQMREDALIKLKRQYQLEDQATANQQEIDKENRQEGFAVAADARAADLKTGLLTLSQQYEQRKGETDQAYKERLLRIEGAIKSGQIDQQGKIDLKLESVKAANAKSLAAFNFSNDKQMEAIKNDNERGLVDSVKAGADGAAVVTYKDGHTVRVNGANLNLTGEGGDTSIQSIIDKRKGTATPTAKPAVAVAKAAPAKAVDDADALQANLDQLVASGRVPKGTVEGQSMTGPNGEKAYWTNGRWLIFKMAKPARNRGF